MISRRTFLKASVAASCATYGANSFGGIVFNSRNNHLPKKSILGYQGALRIGSGTLYSLGNGTRVYNPLVGRFIQLDSKRFSPFGYGGVNSYLLSNSDPINLRDPSGNVAILSILIGAIVGAVVGATVSAVSEGIKVATKGGSFNWVNFGSSIAVGAISGGFGAAAVFAPAKVKVGLSIADSVLTGGTEFALDVTVGGSSAKEAGITAATGAAIGLLSFGVGSVGGRVVHKAAANVKSRRARYTALQDIQRKTYLRNKGTRPLDKPLFDDQVAKGFLKVHDIPKGNEFLINELAKNRSGDRFLFAYSERQGVRIFEQTRNSGKGFNPEAFHHQNIFRFSQDILSIGEMFFENEIPHFLANSGHYLPPLHSLAHVKNFFNKAGIDVVIPNWEDSIV